MPSPPVNLKNRQLAALLAWMFPGLGHFYQGRTGKGVLYAVCIMGLFLVGMALGDWHNVIWRWKSPFGNSETFCFYYLGQFWAGLVAFPALVQATLLHYGHDVVLWGFMAEPKQVVINGLYEPEGKFLEIGSIYTFVAGLLNILAIYDAYDGPAYAADDQLAPAGPAATPEPMSKPEVFEVGASA